MDYDQASRIAKFYDLFTGSRYVSQAEQVKLIQADEVYFVALVYCVAVLQAYRQCCAADR